MDGIVKIVIALKLKFLLIILSIGTSYFVEHRLKQEKNTVSVGVITSADSSMDATGTIDAQSLSLKAYTRDSSGSVSSGHFGVQPLNYVANRPIWHQGLEIYIVL